MPSAQEINPFYINSVSPTAAVGVLLLLYKLRQWIGCCSSGTVRRNVQDYRDHLKSVRLQTRQNAAAAPIHAQSVSVKGGREEMSGLQEETHR